MAKARRGQSASKPSTPAQRHQPPAEGGAPGRLAPDLVVAALAGFGLLLTAYLTWVAWSRQAAAFCTEGSGCDVVQGSNWSTLLGVPMALWGFALYALIAFLAVYPRSTRVRRWRHTWRLSLLGLAISVYLTVVGVMVLDAVCAWCLASLATMAAIFAWVTLKRPAAAPGTRWSSWLMGNGLVVVIVVLALQLHQGEWLMKRPEDPRMAALVTHLDLEGAKFYGASWCANCREQKDLFGTSARRLPYVECSPGGPAAPRAFECVSAGIEIYPTWVIDGLQHRQVMQPKELAAITGFDWSGTHP